MSTTVTETKATKDNIGVYTNPAHDLWVADAAPTLEEVHKGEHLKEGEVTVAIKSTGICGYERPNLAGSNKSLTTATDLMCTSGTLAASAL